MGESKRKKKKNSYIHGRKNERQINHYTYADDLSDESSGDERDGLITGDRKYYGGFRKDITVKPSTNAHEIDEFPLSIDVSKKGSQSSIVTILSLCNTMMGTSLLSIPWAINKAGFAWGIILMIFMAGLMFYTSYRILVAVKEMKSSGDLLVNNTDVLEFSDVCRQYLGRFAEFVAFVSSLLTLLGGMIIYWILVSNFMYKFVTFIFHYVEHDAYSHKNHEAGICPTMHKGSHNNTNHTGNLSDYSNYDLGISGGDEHTDDETFKRVWDQQATVPLWLILIIFPLLNFKSAAFFMRFNALGSITVMYLIAFVARMAYSWGIHVNFSDSTDIFYVYEFKETFPILTGVAAMAYFNQNSLLAITRNQKNPDKTVRDLLIAFIIVCCIYVCVGTMIYLSIIKNKDCIADNFLDNFKDTNVMAFIARIGLFLQIMAVFPQLFFIFRLQFMNAVFGKVWPSLKHVLGLNILLVAVCVLFAVFLPKIGHIIGFIGALTGFSFAIALPCLVYMKMRYTQGRLTPPMFAIHCFLIVLGGANFVAQFFVLRE